MIGYLQIRHSEKLAKFNESESESLRNIFEDRNKSQQELEKVEKQIQIEINETQNLLRTRSNWFHPIQTGSKRKLRQKIERILKQHEWHRARYFFITSKSIHQGKNLFAPNVGLEPTTVGLRVQRSTDWASRALIGHRYWLFINKG